jgi:AcrR family transcriptional regulator
MQQRKPRADALRNRERLIDEAKAAFREVGPQVGLDEIARRAEVGIGTLYRHFPTRDAMVEAVYRREIGQFVEAAETLLRTHRPIEALHEWLRLFVDYMATKRLIGPALLAMPGGPSELYASSAPLIMAAVTLLVERGVAAGDIRADFEPEDMLQALTGLASGYSETGWEPRTLRLIDIFVAGLRPSHGK